MGYFIHRNDDQVIYRSWDPTRDARGPLRILILKLDHVGDFWMALGPLKELRRRFAHAHVTLVVGSWNISTARQFELADDYIAFDFFPRNPKISKKKIPATDINKIIDRDFDLAIDMRVPQETRPVLLAIQAHHRAAIVDRHRMPNIDIAIPPIKFKLSRSIFYKLLQRIPLASRLPRRWFDPYAARNQMRLQHVAETLYFLVAKAAAYFEEHAEADHRLNHDITDAGPIIIAPFSNSHLRDWPIESFHELIVSLSVRSKIILVGRNEDKAALQNIVDATSSAGAQNVEIAADLNEQEFNRLLGSASLVVSNNSGAGHVAAQLGRPTLGIFTASHLPELWGFQGPKVSMLMSTIECRGCGLDAVHRCPEKVRCKFDITPEKVLAEIANLIDRKLPAIAF